MTSTLQKSALLLALIPMLGLGACSEDESSDPNPNTEVESGDTSGTGDTTGASNGVSNTTVTDDALTWYRDIKPILDANCVACHQADGGAPFDLDSYAAFKPVAQASMAAMDGGSMPPWLPDPDCREFEGQRVMPTAQIEKVRAWIALDMPEGDPNDAPDTQVQEQGLGFEPTHTFPIAEPYVPNPDLPDDYRCFILDAEFEEDTYMTASAIVPDSKALVHHVLVYSMGPESVDLITNAEQNEAGPGYTCFGAPWPEGAAGLSLASLPNLVGGWVPGQEANLSGPETSTRIDAGSKLVMQIHYNTLAGPPMADLTSIQMALQSEPTPYLGYTRPLVIIDLDIPAGEPEAKHFREFRNYSDRTISIARMAPHMHLLGKSVRSEILREDGSTECALDIPDWDFNWQQSYRLPNNGTLDLKPGEGISLACAYDNSMSNQPVFNGEQIEPRDVGWGDGTFDEMCLMYLTFVEPFEEKPPVPEPGAAACASVQACQAACPDDASSLECLLSCENLGEDCLYCAVEGMFGCTPCGGNIIGLLDCFTECTITTSILDGKLSKCLKTECGEGYDSMVACVDPAIEAGACDTTLRSCGLER